MSSLERRLRRLAVIVPLFAIAAAAFGMLPDGVDVYHYSYKHGTSTFDHTTRAGGWAVVAWAVLQAIACKWVHGAPSRFAGVMWLVCSLLIYVVCAIAWFFEMFTLAPETMEWPAHATAVCAGAAAVLVFVGLPIILLASARARSSDAPRARVV